MSIKTIAIVALVALAAIAAALTGPATMQAGPKPGLVPGKWQGTGVISGSITDVVGKTTFSGKVGFRINIRKDFAVGGTGSWVKQMDGAGTDMSSSMTGIATMYFGESGQGGIKITYFEEVEGTVTVNGRTHPMKFTTKDKTASLVITKARKCSAVGVIPAGGGMRITWTAKRVGKCVE